MLLSLAAVTVLVPSYDDGLAFFRDVLGFAVLEDTQLSPTKRWIVVARRAAQAPRWCSRFRETKAKGNHLPPRHRSRLSSRPCRSQTSEVRTQSPRRIASYSYGFRPDRRPF